MLNEIVKYKYLDHYLENSLSKSAARDRITLKNKFMAFGEKIEDVLHKDLCLLTREEIINNFANVLPTKRSTAIGWISFARTYTQWCLDHNQLGCSSNAYVNLDLNEIVGWKPGSDLLRDEEMLTMILDDILYPVNAGMVDNLYRPVYYLLFAGLTLNEIVKIKYDDVDFSNSTVINPSTNKLVSVNSTALKIIKSVHKLDSLDMTIRNERCRQREIFGDEYAIKRCSEDRTTYSVFLFNRISQDHSVAREHGFVVTLKPISIIQSGIFSRMYQAEKLTGEVDYTEFVNFRLQTDTRSSSALPEAYRVGACEYEGWKQHYNL